MTEPQPKLTGFAKVKQVLKAAQGALEVFAKGVIVLFVLGSMFLFGKAADPALAHPERKVEFADRFLSWSFVVFSVGLAELFVLFVVLSVMGKIDLAAAFYDKDPALAPTPAPDAPGGSASQDGKDDAKAQGAAPTAASDAPGESTPPNGEDEAEAQGVAPAAVTSAKPAANASGKRRGKLQTPPVSLARLQAFMWTLVVMTIYFHRVVKDENNGLPTIPPELLMVMGISGATYLVSKRISASATTKTPEGK